MSTSAQDFNAQIKEKFRANGGRVGGPFERMLGTLRMSDAERLPRPLGCIRSSSWRRQAAPNERSS
jgi:hypothetical protein